MRVGIDLTALLPRHTGVDKYLINLVRSLAGIDQETSYVLFVNHADRGLFDRSSRARLPDNFRLLPVSLRPRAARLLFQQAIQPAALRVLGVEVLHSPSFIMPMLRGGSRHLLTIHDMTSFTLPECHIALRRSGSYRRAVELSIRGADLISVPSLSVKRDIIEIVDGVDPELIRVIPSGIEESFRVRSRDEAGERLRPLGVDWPYILFVGTIEPRKNLPRLLASYGDLVAQGDVAEHLVLAGPMGWEVDGLLDSLRRSELRERIHLLGYVRDIDLPWLYAGATLFAYPSLQEGFGFPPLEAMASGVPVVASLSSAMIDNLSGAAELVAPDDVRALTGAMRRLLRDPALRARHIECGLARAESFRWDSFARRTLQCYRDLAVSRG